MRRRQFVELATLGLASPRTLALTPRRKAQVAHVVDFVPAEKKQAVLAGKAPAQTYIQSALSSGANVVLAPPRARLLLEPAGVKHVGKARVPYCLTMLDGVELDLEGSTLFIRPQDTAAVIVNDGMGVRINHSIKMRNGKIDGGSPLASNSASPDLEVGCITLHGVTGSEVRNMVVTGARQYAGRFLKCSDSVFRSLICESSGGDGWSFGIDANEQQVVRTTIENIVARNCQGRHPGLAGNGVIFTVQDCRVGLVVTSDCAGGVKIQDSSRDSSFEEIVFNGGDNGTANSGVKVQGNSSAGLFPTRVTVKRVRSTNSAGEGLAIRFVGAVNVDSYVGTHNSTLLKNRDVDLRGDMVRVRELISKQSAGEGVSIAGTGRYALGSVFVEDARAPGLHVASKCECHIHDLTIVDCGGGIFISDKDAVGEILVATLRLSRAASGPVHVKSVARGFHICEMRDATQQMDFGC